MILGKDNKRIRNKMGDNGHFYFGDPAAWQQIGKSARWALMYSIGVAKVPVADKTTVKIEDVRDASMEIDLLQSHADEFGLIDILRASETLSFWGDAGKIKSDNLEIYVPEFIIVGDIKIETPASDAIKINFKLEIQPQSGLFTFQSADLPVATKTGDTPITSLNEYFAYYVAIPD